MKVPCAGRIIFKYNEPDWLPQSLENLGELVPNESYAEVPGDFCALPHLDAVNAFESSKSIPFR
jgi:hypothetical protein